MAPTYRKLHAKIVNSFDVNEMPDDFARLLWVLLPLKLCREGRGIDSASWIRSNVFPLREDVTLEAIRDTMDWYEQHEMIVRYQVDGRPYFYVPSFAIYQKGNDREADSLFPPPPDQRQEDDNIAPDQVSTKSRPGLGQVPTKSSLDVDIDIDIDLIPGAKAPTPPPKKPIKTRIPRKPLTGKNAIKAALEIRFSEITSIPRPAVKTARQKRTAGARWWTPLLAIATLTNGDAEGAMRLMEAAVAQMDADGLTISAPQSILAVCQSIHGKQQRGASDNNRNQPRSQRNLTADIETIVQAMENHGRFWEPKFEDPFLQAMAGRLDWVRMGEINVGKFEAAVRDAWFTARQQHSEAAT